MAQAAPISTTIARTSKIAHATSFALGMIAALPEVSPKLFRATRPLRAFLGRIAPARGAYLDGYDLVADRFAEAAK